MKKLRVFWFLPVVAIEFVFLVLAWIFALAGFLKLSEWIVLFFEITPNFEWYFEGWNRAQVTK